MRGPETDPFGLKRVGFSLSTPRADGNFAHYSLLACIFTHLFFDCVYFKWYHLWASSLARALFENVLYKGWSGSMLRDAKYIFNTLSAATADPPTAPLPMSGAPSP